MNLLDIPKIIIDTSYIIILMSKVPLSFLPFSNFCKTFILKQEKFGSNTKNLVCVFIRIIKNMVKIHTNKYPSFKIPVKILAVIQNSVEKSAQKKFYDP